MPSLNAERYFQYPNEGYQEALCEEARDAIKLENYNFLYPDWKAWIHCPLFIFMDKRKRAKERAESTRQSMEYARHAGLMMIDYKDGIEFKKTAIVRRM